MIFRLSQKLNAKIKAGPVQSLPLHENPFADWSAHLFMAGRTQYILLSNTKSLYSTVLPGKGVTDESNFIERALSSIRGFLADDEYEGIFERFIAPVSKSVRFAKALNRSVTGSMNDLINHAQSWLLDNDTSPLDLRVNLNEILLSALGESKSRPYGKPLKAFMEIVNRAGS